MYKVSDLEKLVKVLKDNYIDEVRIEPNLRTRCYDMPVTYKFVPGREQPIAEILLKLEYSEQTGSESSYTRKGGVVVIRAEEI